MTKAIMMFTVVLCIAPLAFLPITHAASPCPATVVHPMMTITKDVDASNEVSEFMNGIEAHCPEGTRVTDPKKTLHDHMTYKDIFNADANLECVK